MAEVRKKVVEDKYNTSKIKTKKETKKKENNVEKVSKKKQENSTKKKSIFAKIMIFFNGVRSEAHKVHWTTKENMIKYSIATMVFMIFCSVFFYLIDIVFALVQRLFA